MAFDHKAALERANAAYPLFDRSKKTLVIMQWYDRHDKQQGINEPVYLAPHYFKPSEHIYYYLDNQSCNADNEGASNDMYAYQLINDEWVLVCEV